MQGASNQGPLDEGQLKKYKSTYEELGYVILPAPTLLSPEELSLLKEASARVIARTRAGEWPLRRVVGKQFPPFDTDEAVPDVWGVQHVMHYDLAEPAFAQWYGSEKLVRTMAFLLGCNEAEVQMELFNILVNPVRHKFALRWHRDDVHEEATEAEERDVLNASHYGIQWNTALYSDSCLYVVPKSHLLPSTPEQRALSKTATTPDDPLVMPGSIQVKLNPGDTVIYNNNILHTGAYTTGAQRETLHACMGNTRGGVARARNILQHDVRWMRDDKFLATFKDSELREGPGGGEKERLRGMYELLLKMERSAGNAEALGYSQQRN